MYGETGRMVPRTEHPHGEDFVRAKVRQLDWLTGGLPGVTWSIVACDDGCPDQPASGDLMARIAAGEGYPSGGHRGVSVIRLADLIGATLDQPGFDRLPSTDESRKGGSILAALHAVTTGPAGTPSPANGRRTNAPAGTSSATPTPTCPRTWPSSARSPRRSWPATASSARSASGTAWTARCWSGPTARRSSRAAPATSPTRSSSCSGTSSACCSSRRSRTCSTPRPGSRPSTRAALRPVLGEMTSVNETFDVELLVRLAQRYGPGALAVEPIVFTEDFAATNFPSVDPGRPAPGDGPPGRGPLRPAGRARSRPSPARPRSCSPCCARSTSTAT